MQEESASAERSVAQKLLVPGLVVLAAGVLWMLARDTLSIDRLAEHEASLREYQQENPWLILLIVFAVYVVVTGLSVPGAAVMTLVVAWFFGFWPAVGLVSFASTLGATIAFLLSRYLLRDTIQNRFSEQLVRFNEALDREGAFYLFTLRLIPAVPFFVINVVMGLTKIRVTTFWWVSQIGMLAGTCVYVYAGTTIPSLSQLADPSLLRVSDIRDWEAFQTRLMWGRHSKAQRGSPAWHLANRLRHVRHARSAKQSPDGKVRFTEEHKLFLTRALNEVLQDPSFVLPTEWEPPKAAGKETERERHRRLTAINRGALVYAFPDLILPPQPILSRQLILAFVVLGVFPLAVRRLMRRFRPQSTGSGDARASEDDSFKD